MSYITAVFYQTWDKIFPFFQGDFVTTVHLKKKKRKSHEQSLNGHLNRLNLRFELRPLLYGDWGSDDRARHPAGPAQGLLGPDKHVRDVLVLAEQRQVEDDLQWFSISGHHNKLSDASVQGFRGCGERRSQLVESISGHHYCNNISSFTLVAYWFKSGFWATPPHCISLTIDESLGQKCIILTSTLYYVYWSWLCPSPGKRIGKNPSGKIYLYFFFTTFMW